MPHLGSRHTASHQVLGRTGCLAIGAIAGWRRPLGLIPTGLAARPILQQGLGRPDFDLQAITGENVRLRCHEKHEIDANGHVDTYMKGLKRYHGVQYGEGYACNATFSCVDTVPTSLAYC